MNAQQKQRGHRLRLGPALELRVNSSHPESAVIEIGWCVLPGVLDYLKFMAAIEPHVLLLFIDSHGRERRQLEPLSKGMTFVSFRSSGQHIIYATIVWDDAGMKGLKYWFLRKENGEYHTTVLNDGQVIQRNKAGLGQSRILVVIDEKCFARPIPAWLSWWTNFWFETDPVDECAFRRRMILAFTIQPPVLIVYGVLKLAAFLLLALWWGIVLGRPGVNFLAIWPVYGAEMDNVLTFQSRNGDSFWWHWLRWQISPLFLLAATAVMGAITIGSMDEKAHKIHINLFSSWSLYLTNLAWVVAGAYVLTFTLLAIGLLLGTIPILKERLEKRAQQQALNDTQTIDQRMSYLVCDGTIPSRVSVQNLPPAQRTFDLRFQELKARVCRPFAR